MNKTIILRREKINRENTRQMINQLFDEFVEDSIRKHDTILIKPNLMYYWDASTGETTDPRVVSAIVDKIIDLLGRDINIKIIESDASAMRTKHAFNVLGYKDLLSDNVELFNLSKGEHLTETITVKGSPVKIKINRILRDGHYLINVPKIKLHRNPPILTCALKNNFGLISTPYKHQYHKRLAEYIQAINQAVKNDLIIVDGLVMLGKHPKTMGAIIGADDPITCDVLASKICSVNPQRDMITSKFLSPRYAYNKIEVKDPQNVLESIIKDFPKTNPHFDKLLWDVQLTLLDLYAWIVGDIKPPVLE
jgi:uncharacterized protein (DUF362 family)